MNNRSFVYVSVSMLGATSRVLGTEAADLCVAK